MDLQQKIDDLNKIISDKDIEINELYEVVNRVNNYLKNLIEGTEEGIKAAMHLHRKLTSKKLPSIPGISFTSKYIVSATNLSSYYDLYEIEDSMSVGIIMTDTKGYGVSSLLMSILVSLVNSSYSNDLKKFAQILHSDLKEFIRQMDKKHESNVYAKLCRLDRKTLEFSYVNFGIPLALLIRNNEVIELDTTSESILDADISKFQVKNVKLVPGDKVLIFNNGALSKDRSDIIKIANENKSAPLNDIVNEVVFEIDQDTEGRRAKLKGDVSIVGFELERGVLYAL